MYMYVWKYIYIYIYIFMYVFICMYICKFAQINVFVCMCASIQAFRFHISLSILDIYIFTPSHLEGACVYTKPFQGIALQHSSNTAGAEMFAADAAFKKHTAVHQCSAIKGA